MQRVDRLQGCLEKINRHPDKSGNINQKVIHLLYFFFHQVHRTEKHCVGTVND